MVKKVLITGINGYIGTVLADKLRGANYKIEGIDQNYFKTVLIEKHKDVRSKKLDTRYTNKISLKNIDCIIHLAALSNDPMGALDEKLTHDINYKATVDLARKAKKAGVGRFIFASSCSVYGIAKRGIVDERSKVNPLTAYAKSKILAEKELRKLADDKFCVCIMRNSTVYGYSPRFRNDLVVNNLVTCGFATGKIKILSDGSPWRPLIDVRDLSDILIKFIEIDSKDVNGKIFNIGFKNGNYQVKEILRLVKKKLPKCEVEYTNQHGSDTRSYKVNFNKLYQILPGLKQNWPLEDSIEDLIVRLKKANFSERDFKNGKFVRLNRILYLMNRNKINKELYWEIK